MILFTLVTISILLAIPADANAWGGGTHLMIGLEALNRLNQLPPSLATLLAKASNDFLYGCLAADIIIGKKHTHYLLNCHRWRVGERLLQSARGEAETACAWGYLCHLAADVVAHNYYVPYKILRSFSSLSLRHTYWELRFESFVKAEIWEKAKEVCQAGRPLDDSLLRRVVAPTIFSFGTSKQIFNSILLLSRIEKWQMLIRALSSRSRHQLTTEDREEYLALTMDVVMDLLTHGEESFSRLADPTGEVAIATATEMRRHLRLIYKAGLITKAQGIERSEFLKPTFKRAINQPELLELLKTACQEPDMPITKTG